MKKLLYIFGFLMFASVLFSPAVSLTALGADTKTDTATDSGACDFPYIGCPGSPVNIPDSNWGATFGKSKPEEVGQDLYKNVLVMTRVVPDKKAFKNTAGAFGATESETVRLLRGDFGPIVEKNPYLTQGEAIHKMNEIQQRYDDEKDLYALQANIEAAVTPNEIFANGDTSDSGFDLVNDLDNIQNLLFKRADPIDVGGNFNLGSSGGSGVLGGGSATGPTGAITGPPSMGGGKTDGSKTAAESNELGGASGDIKTLALGANVSGLNPKPDASKNPNICFADTKLDKALQTFDNQKVIDANFKEMPTMSQTNGLFIGPTPGSAAGESSAGSTGPAVAADSLIPLSTDQPATAIKPAPAGKWLKGLPCNDILCIQVNFVKKTATAYVDSDNCIACHIEKINEKLKETINHSLIPSKATGNLLEPGLCKQAAADQFGDANIHFYALAKPILTPINDDLIYGTNVTDEWDKFINTTKPFPFFEKKIPDPNDPDQDAFIPTVNDRAAKAAGANSTDDTTLETITSNIQAEKNTIKKNLAEKAAVAAVAVQSDADNSFFQSIRRELEQMNYYFDAFQKILHTINDDKDKDSACQKIPNIPQCT